jgi:tetratricopeptide (TPR) repeat protein
MKQIFLLFITVIISTHLSSQVITKPNFALATHPIVVDEISFSDSLIIVTLTVQNQIEDGEFCANEIMYLMELKNENKTYLVKTSGIPTCPTAYKFETIGEKLTFTMEFPAFNELPKYINIVEDCDENCFSIYGVIIDEKMNEDINQAYGYFKSENLDFALASFRTAARENPGYPFAFLYGNIIEIYALQENYEKAKQWYQFLSNSQFVDKDLVMEQISQKEFYDQLSD